MSKGPKFTPGPWVASEQDTWRVEWDGTYRNDGYIIAYRLEGPDAKPNAHLIAAAPELYEACALLEKAENYHHNKCRECEGEGEPEACSKCFPLFDNARIARRSALAKAKG